MRTNYADLMDKINETGEWNDEIEAELKKAVEEFATTGSY
jgi:F-type H+-transporting ATPase subunit alpha